MNYFLLVLLIITISLIACIITTYFVQLKKDVEYCIKDIYNLKELNKVEAPRGK